MKSKLFAYRHRREHTFVIGLWVTHPHEMFVDAMNLGGSPNNFTKENAESFRHNMFSPISAGEISRQLKEEYSNHLHGMNDMSGNQSEKIMKQTSTKVSVSMTKKSF